MSAKWLETRHEIYQSLVDKLLIGVIVLVAALYLNVALEDHKSELAHDRALWDKRLTAMIDLRVDYNACLENLFEFWKASGGYRDEPTAHTLLELEKRKLEFRKALSVFLSNSNKWGVLFDTKFENELRNHYYILSSFLKIDGDRAFDVPAFVSGLADNFDSHTTNALNGFYSVERRQLTNIGFQPVAFDQAVHYKDLAGYLRVNLDQWESK